MTKNRPRKIFISAAETSGDQHAARLIRQLKLDMPDLRYDGLGGAAMAEQNCKLLENMVDRSAMLAGALSQIGFFMKLKHRVRDYLRHERPDLVVVVDSPAWNFHVAKEAKKLDIPVLHYIAPQLWAWGQWRLKKLKRLTNQVACILPFEEKWFSDRGIPAKYVGHPLFDDDNHVEPVSPWSHESKQYPTIALLPGSRKQEIHRLWPVMQKIAKTIQNKYPDARFLTAASSEQNFNLLTRSSDPALNIEIRQTGIEPATRHADFCIVASGTATLEVAAQNCPMIIMYYVNPLQWHLIGKRLIKTRYLSLVNILADKELVPEYMPFFYSQTDDLAQRSLALLDDPEKLQAMRLALRELIAPITKPGASKNVAHIIQNMLPQF